ncbi:AraC family transcriptional regulator [Paraburkholderia sacchari]|uniref:helix-turn-helix domain-containing protein n=1 Tax=Paraburkholderia sacchari TaxID=159450 RepID=UPI0039A694A4
MSQSSYNFRFSAIFFIDHLRCHAEREKQRTRCVRAVGEYPDCDMQAVLAILELHMSDGVYKRHTRPAATTTMETTLISSNDSCASAGCSAQTVVSSIASQTCRHPNYVVRTNQNEVIGARWRHPTSSGTVPDTDLTTIVFHLGGSTSVERWRPDLRKLDRGSRIGTVTLLPPHEASRWHMRDDVETLHIYIPPSVFSSEVGYEPKILFKDVFSQKNIWLCRFGELMRTYAESHLGDAKAGDSLLLEQMRDSMARYLTLQYAASQDTASSARATRSRRAWLSPAATRKITDWLSDHYSENVSVKDMAALTCLSESYFLKAFRDTVGQTPYRYLQQLRLSAARELLRESDTPVADVALACGYGSTSHFCVEFRREVGTSPGKYRQQIQGVVA